MFTSPSFHLPPFISTSPHPFLIFYSFTPLFSFFLIPYGNYSFYSSSLLSLPPFYKYFPWSRTSLLIIFHLLNFFLLPTHLSLSAWPKETQTRQCYQTNIGSKRILATFCNIAKKKQGEERNEEESHANFTTAYNVTKSEKDETDRKW